MSKAIAFAKLDYITVKPYMTIKNLMIFIMVAVIMSITSGGSVSSIGIFMAMAAIFISYPFAICEKNGTDGLYAALAINRDTVVIGRYLFALSIDLLSAIISLVIAFVISAVMRTEFNAVESLSIVAAMLLVFSLVQAFQLPVFFRVGYMAGKLVTYLPFVFFPLVVLVIVNYNSDSMFFMQSLFNWIDSNSVLAALVIFAVWLLLMTLSIKTSQSMYKKRDL